MRLQYPIDTGFRDEVLALVGECQRQLTRAQVRLVERHAKDLTAHIIGYAVPSRPLWSGSHVFKPGFAEAAIEIVPVDRQAIAEQSPRGGDRTLVATRRS